MKKFISALFAIALVFSSVAMSGCATSKESSEKLVIYTWENYIPPEIVKQFEEETGITVEYANFGTNEEMYASFSQKSNQYDIIVCSDYIIELMISEGGLLHEIDSSKIENYKNINPSYQSMYFDPDNKYSIPHATGSPVIVYDSAKVTNPPKGYKDLWNEEYKESIVLLDGARDIIGLTLLMMGESINETDPEILEKAKEKLLELKPNVIAFNADTPHESIIRGDATVGYMFGSQAVAAKEAVPTVEFVIPEEGISTNLDCYVVSKNAPNLENAYKFLNYVLDGKISAQISSIINYANCNIAATEFLPEEYLNNQSVNIPDEIMEKAQLYRDIGEAYVLYDKIWTEFKAAR